MQKLIVLLLAVFVCHVRPEVAIKYKDLLLKLHNDHRKSQGGSDMNKLEWDDQLAAEANTWVSRCRFEHNNTQSMEGRGENLAYSSVKPMEDFIKTAMKDWYDEINMYNYYGKACVASCHYTQIVWAKTKKVGCAINTCNSLANSGSREPSLYIACWYDPKGNDMSEYPYSKEGAACSACWKGQKCEDGLCSGEGKEDCKDRDPQQCPMWEAMGQCTGNRPYMIKHCRLSCEFCEGEANPDDCKDTWANPADCEDWKDDCESNKSFMAGSCRKTCGFC